MAHDVVVTHGMDDVLGLENAEAYRCIVWQYHVSHSWLQVILEAEAQRIFVSFGMVSHFEGNLRWQGANFRTASEEAYLEFLKTTNPDPKYIEIQQKISCLYLVDTPYSQVKILAFPRITLTHQWREYEQIAGDKMLERITMDVETGEPCVISTGWHHGLKPELKPKVLLSQILEHLEQGYTQAEILSQFTWLEPEDIQAALIYARRAIGRPSGTE